MAGTSIPFFLYSTGAPPFVVTGGNRSMLAFWLGGASSTTGAVTPPPTPTPTPAAPSPGGVGRYTGPAFPRKKKRLDDLYETADLRPPDPGPAVPDLAPPEPGPAVEDIGASPLPKLVDTGPIKQARPLIDPKRQAQEQDDEEAIVALISRLLH